MLDETREHRVAVPGVAKLPFVVVVDPGEDAFQRAVLLLQGRARRVERLPNVCGRLLNSAPPCPIRHEELVLVRVGPCHRLGHTLRNELLRLLLKSVGQPFQEEQTEDVRLVVAAVDRPAEDVRRRPEVLLQLRDAQRVGRRDRRGHHWTGSRRRFSPAATLRCRGWPDEARNKSRLPPARIIHVERVTQFFQPVSGEALQQVVKADPSGAGQCVDELRLDAAIVDPHVVVVDRGT